MAPLLVFAVLTAADLDISYMEGEINILSGIESFNLDINLFMSGPPKRVATNLIEHNEVKEAGKILG